jgi:transposase
VAVRGEKQPWQADNTPDGIDCLVKQMVDLQPELIVVEAAGGYQRTVVDALFHAGLSVAVVNPARVRQFARASGLLAKTDKLDAFVLAEFGRQMQPRRYEGKNEAEKQLSALLVRRKQLEEILKAEQNCLRTISPSLRGSVERSSALGTHDRMFHGLSIPHKETDHRAVSENAQRLARIRLIIRKMPKYRENSFSCSDQSPTARRDERTPLCWAVPASGSHCCLRIVSAIRLICFTCGRSCCASHCA